MTSQFNSTPPEPKDTGGADMSGPEPALQEVWWQIVSHRGEVVALHVDRMANDEWGLMLYRNQSFWQYRRVESKACALAQSAMWLRQCRDKDPDETES